MRQDLPGKFLLVKRCPVDWEKFSPLDLLNTRPLKLNGRTAELEGPAESLSNFFPKGGGVILGKGGGMTRLLNPDDSTLLEIPEAGAWLLVLLEIGPEDFRVNPGGGPAEVGVLFFTMSANELLGETLGEAELVEVIISRIRQSPKVMRSNLDAKQSPDT